MGISEKELLMSAVNVAEGIAPPVNTEQQPPAEKMLPQSEVDKLARGARLDGENKARQMIEQQAAKIAELEQQIAQIGQSLGQANQNTTQNNVAPQGTDMVEVVKQEMVNQQQRAIRAEQARQVDELLQRFDSEMARGSETREDFAKVTSKFNKDAFPEITIMAAQMDNLPDIMYELNKNPMKLGYISELARRDPKYAFQELKELSESLKSNANALANHVSPLKPLGTVKASTAGTDNGKRSVTDWKKFYRNKR
jgi:hypothetical protein